MSYESRLKEMYPNEVKLVQECMSKLGLEVNITSVKTLEKISNCLDLFKNNKSNSSELQSYYNSVKNAVYTLVWNTRRFLNN